MRALYAVAGGIVCYLLGVYVVPIALGQVSWIGDAWMHSLTWGRVLAAVTNLAVPFAIGYFVYVFLALKRSWTILFSLLVVLLSEVIATIAFSAFGLQDQPYPALTVFHSMLRGLVALIGALVATRVSKSTLQHR